MIDIENIKYIDVTTSSKKEGLHGDKYFIPFKKSLDRKQMFLNIDKFISFAMHAKHVTPHLRFKIGPKGWNKQDIPFFFPCKHLSNVTLPEDFIKIVSQMYKNKNQNRSV